MTEVPTFRKPDRYKSSSYRAYNTKMPGYYDSAYFVWLFQLPLWHRSVAEELHSHVSTLDILDMGCGTGSLLAELAKSGIRQLINLFTKIVPHDGDYRFYTTGRAQELLEEVGFTITKTKRVGIWAYFIDAVKFSEDHSAV